MRKKSPIVIEKLIVQSERELKVMQEDLDGQPKKPSQWSRRLAASGKVGDLRPRWSKRFAASGKEPPVAPKIRKAY